MDRNLMNKHIESSFHSDINPILLVDGSNNDMFFCADVVGSRRFAVNFGGYPRSEIAEINAAATLQEQMNLLSALNDFTPSSNPNSGLSDVEIMLSHKSKYLQTATEIQGWITEQINIRDAKAAQNNKSVTFDDTIQFKESDNPTTE